MKQATTKRLEKRLEELISAFSTVEGYSDRELLFLAECEKRWLDGKGAPHFIRAECDRIFECVLPDWLKLQQQKKLQQQQELERQKESEQQEKLQQKEEREQQKELQHQEKLRQEEELKQQKESQQQEEIEYEESERRAFDEFLKQERQRMHLPPTKEESDEFGVRMDVWSQQRPKPPGGCSSAEFWERVRQRTIRNDVQRVG